MQSLVNHPGHTHSENDHKDYQTGISILRARPNTFFAFVQTAKTLKPPQVPCPGQKPRHAGGVTLVRELGKRLRFRKLIAQHLTESRTWLEVTLELWKPTLREALKET
jgi:hypothetical protein